jgi:hypothetical protein
MSQQRAAKPLVLPTSVASPVPAEGSVSAQVRSTRHSSSKQASNSTDEIVSPPERLGSSRALTQLVRILARQAAQGWCAGDGYVSTTVAKGEDACACSISPDSSAPPSDVGSRTPTASDPVSGNELTSRRRLRTHDREG